MKIATLVFCALGLIFPNTTLAADEKIRVGAWNVKAGKKNGVRHIYKERVPRIAQIIAVMNPDVLAVSEIAPNKRLDDIVSALANVGLCFKQTHLEQPSDKTELNVGFIFGCHVEVSNVQLIAGSGYGSDNKREALAADFKVGNFDFTAISVHFKSGGDGAEQRLRKAQIETVNSHIEANIVAREEDILVMGDYNMDPERDGWNFSTFSATGALRFISSEQLEPRPGYTHVFSYIAGSDPRNLLDGFSIGATNTREYVDSSIKVLPMDELFTDGDLSEFKSRYSDHLPLMAEFLNEDRD